MVLNILAISDVEDEALWDVNEPGALTGDVDLVLSCGDLNPLYLSFIATYTKAPVLYVHGNHDGRYRNSPPEGCICIEDSIFEYKGIRILGLGGSIRYSSGLHQYTQNEMEKRIKRLRFKLWREKGFDILLTHSPAFGLGDDNDRAHEGFNAFIRLIEAYKPLALVHGHTHLNYGHDKKRLIEYQDTLIINAFQKYGFSIETEGTPKISAPRLSR